MRGEGWAAEGGTGEAGAAVQISVQPQAESTPVDREGTVDGFTVKSLKF